MPARPGVDIVYRVPLSLYAAYRRHAVIIRSHDPDALVAGCPEWERDRVVGIEIESLDADTEPLVTWGHGLPIELVMHDPVREFPLLYRHAALTEQHPVRVRIPVVPGFARAVRLASALELAVRLEVTQPPPDLIDELATVADFYLHQSSCAQPIDYFHGVLLARYRGYRTTLWQVLDEDPAYIRYMADDGTLPLSRPVRLEPARECTTCDSWTVCGGYFKWPRPEFDCRGVKAVFRTLANAADEIRRDLSTYAA
jgi:hypothetical protein